MSRHSLAVIVLFLLASSPALAAPPEGLAPRRSADKLQRLRAPMNVPIDHLVVKFHEGTRVRLRGGVLIALERDDRDRRDLAARGLTEVGVDDDVAEARRLIALEPRVRGVHRLFQQAEDLLAERRRRGEERSGRELADLDLYYQLRLPARTTASQVEELLAALNGLASVEIAYAEPVPAPAMVEPLRWVGAPTHFPCQSPDFQSLQGYLNPAPQGVDALYSWTQPGGAGLGIKIVDVEGAWRLTHEDLPSVFWAGGTQNPSLSWRNHGTAVLGEIAGRENNCGVTGIANQAQVGVQSIYGSTVASAISTAATQAGAGGIVLIELHAPGPTPQDPSIPCTCNTLQCYFIAEEYWQANFDAIATATANGTNVVEAGGNGSTDLDHPVYGNLFNRSYRDSGAILVAASLSTSRTPTCWTNWGSRIDVHAWGENVVTAGYGDLQGGGNEDLWYTAVFGGTSSASPIVVGAAAGLQGVTLARGLGPLTPATMRQWLTDTGTPQVPGTKHIGSQPDLLAAFACQIAINLELQNQSIDSTQTFEACDTIFAGPNLTIEPSGNVTLHAGRRVVLRSGFRVKSGAIFRSVVP